MLNKVLNSSIAEGVKKQRLANAEKEKAVAGNVENAPEFLALKAENEKKC